VANPTPVFAEDKACAGPAIGRLAAGHAVPPAVTGRRARVRGTSRRARWVARRQTQHVVAVDTSFPDQPDRHALWQGYVLLLSRCLCGGIARPAKPVRGAIKSPPVRLFGVPRHRAGRHHEDSLAG